MIDYALWEVIENSATLLKITTMEAVVTVMPITTAKEKAQRRLEVKVKSTLMMGIPNEHHLKFKSIKDAKKLLEAVEKSFVNVANSTNIDNLSDAVICAFFASQPNSPQLVHDDLQQIYLDDMEEIDLRWQMAMLTIRSDQAEEGPNYALMAFSSSSPDSKVSNDSICSKYCLETVEHLKSQNDQLLKYLKKSELMVLAYKTGLESVEEKLEVYKANESIYLQDIKGLKFEIHIGEITIRELRKKLDIVQKEKDGIQLNVDKFERASKNEFVNEHVVENCKAMSSKEEPKVVRKNDDAPCNPQIDLQEQGVIDSGCSRHMTGNMSYLTDYEDIDGGYVAFGGNPKGGKITGKGNIKTGNLDIENVYFLRELKFNLFSVSQMCDKKNSVLFNDTECIVLSPNFKLIDESQVLLRVPRKNNMYSVDLKNIVPKGGLTCLFAKATSDESKLWHRRLGYVNFKTMNRLVKGNLVRGLPSKFLKMIKPVLLVKRENSTEPLDETSGILKSFITGIENLVDYKVKMIRCDNGTDTATTVSVATTTTATTVEEITLVQALADLKSTKPKAKGIAFREPGESITTTTPIPSKIQAKANIAWDDIQAKVDADFQLAERLQAEEQEQFTIEQKATLFKELLEQRRKHFAAIRAEEKRNKPPTKNQQKNTMITYLKNMQGWKHKDMQCNDFDSIKELFAKALKRVNMFVYFRTELLEGSSKRAGIKLEQEVTKKQKMDDVQETAKVDNDQEAAKIKELMEIVLDEEEVAIDAIPLVVKPPSIVDWRIHTEGKKREDLETLWKLVKAKHGSTRPDEGYERVLWGDLKIYMLVEKKYHLTPTTITNMLNKKFQYIVALIDVNAAQSKLVLLENFNENYSKCLRLVVKLQLYNASTKFKGKEIAKLITPPSELASEEDSHPEQTRRDKDMQKNLALNAKYFKKIYKPTNNNLRTSSNSRNKNVDTTLRYNNDNQTGQFRNQRTVTVAGARETVGSQVVQQTGIQCFNCKEFDHFTKECRKPKRVKDYTYHKEKMLLCKQAEKCVPLQAEQADWLEDTNEEIDEQELEAHYIHNDAKYNVFANVRQHSKQPESTSNTCLVENDDSNVTPDSPDMCDNDIQTDQNAEDERAALANLIANLKLNVDENKKIQKQLKKANASLAHELKECKSILAETSKTLGESNSIQDSCLVALQNKQTEFESLENHSHNHFRAPTALDMEVLIKTCLMPLAIKTQNDSFTFVHELKQEMHADLKYVESLENEIDELKSDKAEFSNMYDILLQECVSNDVMCSYLHSLSDLDAHSKLQCLYLHKVKECECLAQKLSKQTESVSKEVYTELL
ncbi:retrovirus-related pol polyprotein from transposon TNT 1-94 [Tanacetum coccineum]|uniref:Retrovirus-related pol polyprotein from transposon TNT 1-94 n=1 Tax=Tanacetum coccineum TaxID=301880 RepID=A0ABQ4YH56_9ASTR